MIRLDVQEYCHGDCMEFVPNVIPPHRETTNSDGDCRMTDTIVTCKNRNRCEAIRRYLLNMLKIKEERDDLS